jgi:hypothetical protein
MFVVDMTDICLLGVRMKTVGNGRKTLQPFSTFTFEYENKSKNGKVGHENERTYRISRISKTNQFERNYIEHGRYTKIKYGILIHNT